jgi:hypothetical protein
MNYLNHFNFLWLYIYIYIYFTEPVKLIEGNKKHSSFEKLPEQFKKPYEFKSYTVMAQCIIDECIVVLNNFDMKKSINVCSRLTYFIISILSIKNNKMKKKFWLL